MQPLNYKKIVRNLFKKKIVTKSFSPAPSAYVYMDNQGNILDTVFSSKENEIRKNASVNAIVSKQSSIIDEAELVAKEKSNKADTISKNKSVISFLDWIENPNSRPTPTSRADIFYHLLSEYAKCGVAGMIFTFDKVMTINRWKNIKLAKDVDIVNVLGEIYYLITIDNKEFKFTYSLENLNFSCQNGDELMILYVFGSYDVKEKRYESRFAGVFEYILLQNYLIKFATSFHKNACFPSQIVQLTYKNLETGQELSEYQKSEFEDAVKQVKLQLQQTKGSSNAGSAIVPNHPALEIKVTPLSIPTNASENIAYHTLVSDKIFGFVDGGSSAAFEGKSEYSNNASAKLLDLYDGTFRTANSVIIKSLTRFMKNMLRVMLVNVENLYLALDKSSVVIYQDRTITQTAMLSQNNLMTINEAKKILASTKDVYGDLNFSDPKYNVTNAELGGKQSQAPNV
jgi:hypothetical protein